MRKFLRNIIELFKSPETGIRLIHENGCLKSGIIVGIIGVCAQEIVRAIWFLELSIGSLITTIISDIFLSTLYFFGFILLTFAVSKVFKGDGTLKKFTASAGWSFFPLIILGLLFIPVSLFMGGQQDTSSLLVKIVLIFSVPLRLLMVVQAIWAVRILINAISVSMNLSKRISFVVYIIAFVPMFMIYDFVLF